MVKHPGMITETAAKDYLGRHSQLAVLRTSFLKANQQGSTALVTVAGGNSTGKSRLAKTFLEHVKPSAFVCKGRARKDRRQDQFYAIRLALQGIVKVLTPDTSPDGVSKDIVVNTGRKPLTGKSAIKDMTTEEVWPVSTLISHLTAFVAISEKEKTKNKNTTMTMTSSGVDGQEWPNGPRESGNRANDHDELIDGDGTPASQELSPEQQKTRQEQEQQEAEARDSESDGDTHGHSRHKTATRQLAKDHSENPVDRLKQIFRSFLRAVTQNKPVVLFLDDIQWIDPSSMQALSWFLTDSDLKRFTVVAAYNNNDVHQQHPVAVELRLLRERQSTVPPKHIVLKNLTRGEVNNLVAKTLQAEPTATVQLSEVVHEKTLGNPFFVMQYLWDLQKRKMLTYNMMLSQWQWANVERIRCDTDLATNAVEYVLGKMPDLDEEVENCIKLASCLSSTFSVGLLGRIMTGLDMPEVKRLPELLETAQSIGFIVCLNEPSAQKVPIRGSIGNGLSLNTSERDGYSSDEGCGMDGSDRGGFSSYKGVLRKYIYNTGRSPVGPEGIPDQRFRFSHSKIQQAAYSLVPEGFERDIIHFKIAQRLKDYLVTSNLTGSVRDWVTFIAADQMHRGRSCLTNESDRIELAQLNLEAGTKSCELGAFAPASQYLSNGINIISKVRSPWMKHHNLFLLLHQALAEVAMCTAAPEKSREMTDIVLQHAETKTQRAEACMANARLLGAQLQHGEACSALIRELKAIHFFPSSFPGFRGMASLRSLRLKLAKCSRQQLLTIPQCDKERIIIVMRLLQMLATHATYDGNESMQVLSMTLNVRLALKFGLHKASVSAFTQLGGLVCTRGGNAKEGNRLGSISLALMKRLGVYDTHCTLVTSKYVSPWKLPLMDTIEPLLTTYRKGMRQGQVEMAFMAFNTYLHHGYMSGLSLGPLLDDAKSHQAEIERYGIKWISNPLKIIRQGITSLATESPKPLVFDGEAMTEAEFLKSDHNAVGLYHFYIWKMQVALYYEDLDLADKMRIEALKHNKTMLSFFEMSTMMYCRALIPLRKASLTGSVQHKRQARAAINDLRKAVSKEHKGINLIHKLYLLDAEFLALSRKQSGTIVRRGYDRAITMANRAGVRQDAALGNLRAGLYCIGRDTGWASHYLTRAFNLFSEWGAHGVAAHLRCKYGNLVDEGCQKTFSTNHKGRRRHSEEKEIIHKSSSSMGLITPNSKFMEDEPTDETFGGATLDISTRSSEER